MEIKSWSHGLRDHMKLLWNWFVQVFRATQTWYSLTADFLPVMMSLPEEWCLSGGWMNEWMMHLYSALLCIAVHPKRFTIMWGGVSPQPPPVCSIHLIWRQPQDNGASALSTHQLQVERRERSRQSSGWGLLGGHEWQGPVEGIWPGHRGYTPTLYDECHGIFNDHRESGPRFNVSSERRCFFTV